MVVVDSNLSLFIFDLEGNMLIWQDLKKLPELEESLLRGRESSDFQRLIASKRSVTFKGITYNYETGFKWEFNYQCESIKIQELEYFLSESLPFSNQIIACAQHKGTQRETN